MTRALVSSFLLLLGLVGGGMVTDLGKTLTTFVSKALGAWNAGRAMTLEQRKLSLYHETYQVLLYARGCSPPDAVILLPPRDFVIQKAGHICLLASPSSSYSFLYPRIPIHYGDHAPRENEITHLLVWEHWGLDYVQPRQTPNEGNRVALFELPEGGAHR